MTRRPEGRSPSELRPTTIERRDVGPTEVLIEIKYAGICHSDIHTARDEWGEAMYPLVPGHEIAGVIEHVESAIDTLDRMRELEQYPITSNTNPQ